MSAVAVLVAYGNELRATVPFDAMRRLVVFASVLASGYLALRWVGGHLALLSLGVVVHTFVSLYLAGRLELIPLSIPKNLDQRG